MGSDVRMSTDLKTWLGIHTKYSRTNLGVDSRKLEQCTATCAAWNLGIQTCLLADAGCTGLLCLCFVQSQHPPQLRAEHVFSDFANAQLQVYDVHHVAEVDVCQDKQAYVGPMMSCQSWSASTFRLCL
jgi:hypothetical protein